MKMPARAPYGWQVLAACIIGAAVSPATLINVPFGLFIRALESGQHWSRPEITAALSAFLAVLVLSLPLAGWLVDRWGPRRVLLPSVAAYGVALILLPSFISSPSTLGAGYALIAASSAGAQSLTLVRALCAWFDRRRGLAIGACMAGYGIGYVVIPPLTQFMIERWGWSGAYRGLGLLAIAIALPAAMLWLHDSPAVLGRRHEDAREPRGSQALREPGGSDAPPVTAASGSLSAALAMRELWLLAATFILMSIALNGLQSQLVPLLTDRGMSAAHAALMLSAIGVGSFPGRLLIGVLLDRMFAPRVALMCFATAAIALWWLIDGHDVTGVALAAVTVGVSLGAENDILGFLTARYFGLACFGRVYGLLLGAYLVGAAAGPYLMARTFAATGGYGPALQAGAAAIALACTLQLGMRRYPMENAGDARTG